MFKLRKPALAALALGVTALVVGGSGIAAADSGSAQKIAKPEPVRPATAQAPARLAGVTAAASVNTGAPPTRVQTQASQDGVCDVGDLCLYYLSSQSGYGSGYDTAHNEPYLWDNHFIFAGLGHGATVASNAEAYWN